MEIEIDMNRNALENANEYYGIAKKMKKKKEAAMNMGKSIVLKEKSQKKKRRERPIKEWYEKYHYFFTSGEKLVICGKSAEQNEEIVKKHFDSNDLFFHADVIGGSVAILKDGKKAELKEKLEAAQFSLSYSKLWKEGAAKGNAYCLTKEGVKKSYKGSKAGLGSFFLVGEREWFKNLPLELNIYYDESDEKVYTVPGLIKPRTSYVKIRPGRMKKKEAVKKISSFLNVEESSIESKLPTGRYYLKPARGSEKE